MDCTIDGQAQRHVVIFASLKNLKDLLDSSIYSYIYAHVPPVCMRTCVRVCVYACMCVCVYPNCSAWKKKVGTIFPFKKYKLVYVKWYFVTKKNEY